MNSIGELFEAQPPLADRNRDMPTPRRCSPRVAASTKSPVPSRKEPPHTPPHSATKRPKLGVSSSIAAAPSTFTTPKPAPLSSVVRVEPTGTVGVTMAMAINKTVQSVFDIGVDGLHDANAKMSILGQPCVSARLFACHMLFSRHFPSELSLGERIVLMEPILPFLRAMVRVEFVALSSVEADPSSNSDPSDESQQRSKLVHFSSFDGSCTRPPVDRQLGSALHQHRSIVAMVNAKEQIMALTQPAIQCVRDMLVFLSANFGNNVDDTSMLLACSAAVTPDFPCKRVKALAQLYYNDFDILERRLRAMYATSPEQTVVATPGCVANNTELSVSESLNVEKTLAETIGRAIRFQLRLLLNAAPPRMSKLDTEYETRSTAYSQVGTLIALEMPKDAPTDSAAATEAFFSALVSTALSRLYDYFGMERLVSTDISAPLDMPVSFCLSGASTLARTLRDLRMNPLTTEDVDEVIRDIREATSFLAAARAARFLIDFFSAPGMSHEIQRMSGWTQLEEYASLSRRHSLWKLCLADAHLVSLCDVNSLLERLKGYDAAMTKSLDSCLSGLELVRKNYIITDNNKISAAVRKVTQLVEISTAWTEGMERARSFPLVSFVAV